MNFFSGLFPVVAVVVFTSSFVEVKSLNTCDKTDNDINDATTTVMKKCNSLIKDYYERNINDPTKTKAEIYCTGMKELMQCAVTKTNKFEERFSCTSEVLKGWVFVSSQYIIISKKLQLCDYDTSQLRERMEKLGVLADPRSIHNVNIPDYATRQCAKAIHIECVKSLMSADANLCQDVTAFVLKYVRYTDAAKFPPAGVDKCKGAYAQQHGNKVPEISTKFTQIIEDFSLSLMQLYEKMDRAAGSEMMCQVDPDVDAD